MNLIIASEADSASINLRNRLLEMAPLKKCGQFDGNDVWEITESKGAFCKKGTQLISINQIHIHAENIDEKFEKKRNVKVNNIIFLSRHKAASGKPSLTVHPIGNWGEADYGGIKGAITPASPNLMTSLLREIKNISRLKSKIFSVRQREAKGLGHAIFQAKELVNGEPFAVVLPDRVMHTAKFNSKKDNLAYMRKNFQKNKTSIMLFEKVPHKEVSKYGIAKLEKSFYSHGTTSRVLDILEKPSIKKAPSRYAAVGRYIGRFKSSILIKLFGLKSNSSSTIFTIASFDIFSLLKVST